MYPSARFALTPCWQDALPALSPVPTPPSRPYLALDAQTGLALTDWDTFFRLRDASNVTEEVTRACTWLGQACTDDALGRSAESAPMSEFFTAPPDPGLTDGLSPYNDDCHMSDTLEDEITLQESEMPLTAEMEHETLASQPVSSTEPLGHLAIPVPKNHATTCVDAFLMAVILNHGVRCVTPGNLNVFEVYDYRRYFEFSQSLVGLRARFLGVTPMNRAKALRLWLDGAFPPGCCVFKDGEEGRIGHEPFQLRVQKGHENKVKRRYQCMKQHVKPYL